jgi:protein TonB
MTSLSTNLANSIGSANPTKERIYVQADRRVTGKRFIRLLAQLDRDGYQLPGLLHDASTPPPPVSPPSPELLVPRPYHWIRRPTQAQVFAAFRQNISERTHSGAAYLACSVEADGSLTRCGILKEEPANQGFGAAALSLVRYFLLATPDTPPPPGGFKVIVPIRFDEPRG